MASMTDDERIRLEHQAMMERLMELEELCDNGGNPNEPLRWSSSGKRLAQREKSDGRRNRDQLD